MKMFWTVPMLLGFLALSTSPTAVCQAADTALGGEPGVAWPLRASSNGRYVSDSKGVPVLLIGDSAQSLLGSLSDRMEIRFGNGDGNHRCCNAGWTPYDRLHGAEPRHYR